MRTTLEIRDDLLEDARRASGLRTKRVVVELALAEYLRNQRIQRLRARLGSGVSD